MYLSGKGYYTSELRTELLSEDFSIKINTQKVVSFYGSMQCAHYYTKESKQILFTRKNFLILFTFADTVLSAHKNRKRLKKDLKVKEFTNGFRCV